MHVAAQVRDEHAAERVLRAKAEHEVGEVEQVARRGAGRARERPVVGVAAVERVHVLDFGVDPLELVAALERMRAPRPGVVDLRVVDRRILPLRVGRLPPQVRVAADDLRRQAAGDARIVRQAGQAEGFHARSAEPSPGGFFPACVHE